MKLGLIGFGNIGKGVEELVFKQREAIKNRFGEEISISTILINDLEKERETFDENIVFTNDFESLLEDDEIEGLVEVTATIEEAYHYLSQGLKKGKHVITANKAVVSKYFEELSALAEENKRAFLYEASVGGGVHIIKSVHEDLHLNKIKYIRGILNGTCNFILSEIDGKGSDYNDVLKEAQDLGFAEPDPSADVDGIDTQRKTRILSSLIFGGKVSEEKISSYGISNISVGDIEIFKKKNYKIRLIGEGLVEDGRYFSTVMPNLCPLYTTYANISGSTNCISYYGNNIGQVSFIGAGAGRYPTADAIMRDIIDVFQGTYISGNPLVNEEVEISNYQMNGEFYLRLPKKLSESVENLAIEKFDLGEDISIFTKSIPFSYVQDLIKDLNKDQFFLAKILKEEK